MTKFNVYANGAFWGIIEADDAEGAIQLAADEFGTIDIGEVHASTTGMTAEVVSEDECPGNAKFDPCKAV